MRIKKHISKLLLIGILINNFLFMSNAGVLSSDTRYETFEGSHIKIDDILEEGTVDVEVEGSALVNLVQGVKSKSNSSWISINDKIVFENPTEPGHIEFNIMLKPSTTYTAITKIVENTLECVRWDLFPDTFEEFSLINNKTGVIKHVFTTPSDISLLQSFRYYYPASGTGRVSFEMPIILEGDWTDREIPEYFEGIKSVGQNNNSSYIEIMSQEGNPNLLRNSNWYVAATKDKEANLGGINYGLVDNIDLQSLVGKELTLSFLVHTKGDWKNNYNKPIYGNENSRFGIHCSATWSDSTGKNTKWVTTYPLAGILDNYDIDLKRVSTTQVLTPPSGYDTLERFTFATQSYRLPADNNNETWVLGYPKLEFGNKATPWTPTISEDISGKYHNKIKIDLREPLRSLPSGVKDRIIKKDGQWMVERNCAEFNFKDYPNITLHNGGETTENQMVTFTRWSDLEAVGLPLGKSNNNSGTLSTSINCSNIRGIRKADLYTTSGIGADVTGFNVSMPRTKYTTVEAIRKWLIDSNTSIVYQRAQPVYEPLNIESSVNLYEDITTVSNDSAIPANMRVVVDRVANRAKEFSDIAKLNPTAQNLSQARYWINLMRESALKDEFQENLSNILDISDMTMEKKSVSANTDIYIKSKNTLSLSLDTNNVMFENFNGTESIEKINAVNLTVGSSLPYMVKVYLVDEIQNSDKSNIIDKSVLNIKANSDSVYKTFINTTNPIILLDNQAEGSYNSHGIDFKLNGGLTHKADIYKTTLKFEVEQK